MERSNEDTRVYRPKHILWNPGNELYFSKTNACEKTGKKFSIKMSENVTKRGAISLFLKVLFENGKKTAGTCILGSVYVFCWKTSEHPKHNHWHITKAHTHTLNPWTSLQTQYIYITVFSLWFYWSSLPKTRLWFGPGRRRSPSRWEMKTSYRSSPVL